jgi:hypothetical protein
MAGPDGPGDRGESAVMMTEPVVLVHADRRQTGGELTFPGPASRSGGQ